MVFRASRVLPKYGERRAGRADTGAIIFSVRSSFLRRGIITYVTAKLFFSMINVEDILLRVILLWELASELNINWMKKAIFQEL